jgi:hypothetical protein
MAFSGLGGLGKASAWSACLLIHVREPEEAKAMVVAPFSRQERSGGHGASTMVSRKGVAGLLTMVALAIGWRCSGGLRPCRREAVQCRAT